MSIKYKNIEKGQPGVVGGGEKKHYASVVYAGEVTVDDLVQEIEKFSALSESDIKGVIIALENVVQAKLSQSNIIRLEKLGTLYPAISSRAEDDPKKVTSNSIKKVSVNYRPGPRILKAMKDAGFSKQ